MLSFVEAMTGCGHIGSFAGRVYRLAPEVGNYDSWHDDLGANRLVAMSVNLSTEPYSGGLLQIRHHESKRIVREVANTGVGDAILFQLASALEHRVTDIEGTVPKTASAGWFRSAPEYMRRSASFRRAPTEHQSYRREPEPSRQRAVRFQRVRTYTTAWE